MHSNYFYLIIFITSYVDVAGVVMYVGPVDHEKYFPLGIREVAIMDAGMQVVFLHIFEELAERHRVDLLSGEANVGFIMATSMEVDRTSSKS